MVEVDSGVDDADAHPPAGRVRPRFRSADLGQAPLLGEIGVVGSAGGRGNEPDGEEGAKGQRDSANSHGPAPLVVSVFDWSPGAALCRVPR